MKTARHRMRDSLVILSILAALVAMSGCSESEPPPPSDAQSSTAPVKNVESLPSGTIREGARTMNQGAELGADLEQQKQERDREIESQSE